MYIARVLNAKQIRQFVLFLKEKVASDCVLMMIILATRNNRRHTIRNRILINVSIYSLLIKSLRIHDDKLSNYKDIFIYIVLSNSSNYHVSLFVTLQNVVK